MRIAAFVTCSALLCVSSVQGQAWTRRKNRVRPQTEEVEEPDPAVYGNFAQMNQMAEMQERLGTKGLGGGGLDMQEMLKAMEQMGDMDFGSLMSEGMNMWKEVLDSPEMQEMLENPEQMREAMAPFVEMFGGDVSKLDGILEDPTKLKQSMTEGMEAMQSLFSDPEKMKELADEVMKNIDPATKSQLEKLASGDQNSMQELMSQLDPSGELGQLADAFSDPAKMKELEGLLGDPAKLEELAQSLMGEGGANSLLGNLQAGQKANSGVKLGQFERSEL